MIKVLFICHGNICRSPMAEMIMKQLVRERHMESRFAIASCATSREEIGNPVYPPARAELARHGVPCERRGARQLTARDYEDYDLLLCMDGMNVRNALRLLGGDPRGKVRKLKSCIGSDGDIADPWYNDRFDIAFEEIDACCRALLEELA